MSWRERAATIAREAAAAEKRAGVELNKLKKPPDLPDKQVNSVFSVPPPALFDPDPGTGDRQRRVLDQLEACPHWAYACHAERAEGYWILTVGIRDRGTVELHIPNDRWDGLRVIEMMDKKNLH